MKYNLLPIGVNELSFMKQEKLEEELESFKRNLILNYGLLKISGTDSANICRVKCLNGGCFK